MQLRSPIVFILFIALSARIAAAVGLQYVLDSHLHRSFLIEGDANGYWELAQHLARGDDFAIHHPLRYALRMPGFPTLLASSMLVFGENFLAARIVLSVVGTLGVWLVYLLGKELFDRRIGYWAAGFTAVSPLLVGFTPLILAETSFATAMLLSLWLGNRLKRSVDSQASVVAILRGSVLTGVALALACMMRPSWILAGPIFAILMLFFSSGKVRATLAGTVAVASMVGVLLPWGFRNQQVTGHFTLTTFWMGPSLYDGLNPNATGDSDMRFFDEEALSTKMGEYEVDREYRRRAWEFARQQPGKTAQLAWVKSVRFWKPWPNAAQFDRWTLKLVSALFFLPLCFLAGWGGWALRGQLWSVALLAGPVLYFCVIHMVFVSSLRYRLPTEYPLAVLASYGLARLVSGRRLFDPSDSESDVDVSSGN
ncbi:MAG: glycosyltransferase family 39 protein [Planctomycetaceae bacterium]|nr:glycosyltransferase family 39 protein [Planctomycetaceae bacterium]